MGVSSGRDALMIALMAMGVKPGDAVFVPAFTFAATAGSVASIGASPVFVDVDPLTYNMDPSDLERAIAEVEAEGRLRPAVVMPVDLYGLPANWLTNYVPAVLAIDGPTMQATAARYLPLDRMTLVLVGDLATIRPQIEALPELKGLKLEVASETP